MKVDNYAVLKVNSNLVVNTIVADNKLSIDGFKLMKIESGIFCQIGMYFNGVDGLFYDDAEFTTINEIPVV